MLTIIPPTIPAAAPVLNPNQVIASRISDQGNAAVSAVYATLAQAIQLINMRGVAADGSAIPNGIQQFFADWQTMTPGAPASFLKGAQAVIAMCEAITPGITETLPQLPALTANSDGSVTVA
jgi:hypothetical protein